MKLKVVVKDAIVISSEQLEAFAKLIQVPFSVEPIIEDGTQPEAAPAPVQRARKPKEPKAEAKAEAKEPTKSETKAEAAAPEGLDYNAVLAKFTALVESDFDKAVALLDGYGVSRFSDLNVVQVSELAKKL